MPGPPKILVVDEDTHQLDQIGLWLRQEGFEVLLATSALTAPNLAHNTHPDAIVLNTATPGKEGLEVCRRLREASDACILCLAPEGGMKDAVGAFEAGADDYILSPPVREEVMARLKACLRRRSSRRPNAGGREPDELLWLTDPPRHLVFLDDRMVKLTPKEFEVLQYLAKHCGKVLSADAILTNVWGPEHVGEHHLLKQFIYRLRSKLEPSPDRPRHILTVRGSGYVLDPSS
ncbi:MAG: response regulator transcription factor [Anaerolineales bacterium]|nr:response regulator transcription factor [Anaerolineales bacterium]